MSLLFIGLYIVWFFAFLFMPNMLYGFTYIELFKVMGDKDQRDMSELANLISGNNADNSMQIATKHVFVSLLLSLIFLAIIIVSQILYNKFLLGKMPQKTTSNASNSTHSIIYTGSVVENTKLILNLRVQNFQTMRKLNISTADFNLSINDTPIECQTLKKDKLVTTSSISAKTYTILNLTFNVKLEAKNPVITLKYLNYNLELGKKLTFNNDKLIEE